MRFSKDEKLMLIIVLGLSNDDIEEILGIKVYMGRVYNNFLSGKFKLNDEEKRAMVKIVKYMKKGGRYNEAFEYNDFNYNSSKFPDSDFEKFSLQYLQFEKILDSLRDKLNA